ncbi:hypothetical protein DOT_2365 [Desulfosporosinus sp. OT]|nr:hypothetical protein DOT_2365 [Desulfosporosinus sp. OT]
MQIIIKSQPKGKLVKRQGRKAIGSKALMSTMTAWLPQYN